MFFKVFHVPTLCVLRVYVVELLDGQLRCEFGQEIVNHFGRVDPTAIEFPEQNVDIVGTESSFAREKQEDRGEELDDLSVVLAAQNAGNDVVFTQPFQHGIFGQVLGFLRCDSSRRCILTLVVIHI